MKRAFSTVLLSVVSCAFALAKAEGIVRIGDPYVRATASGGIFVLDDNQGRKLEVTLPIPSAILKGATV